MNWKQRTAIALLAIGIISGAVTGYAYWDWFKSPFQIYLEAEAQTISDLSNEAARFARSAQEWQLTGATAEQLNAKVQFDGLEQVDEDIRPIYEFLQELQWIQTLQTDPTQSSLYGSYRLKHGQDEWAHVEAAVNDQTNGIKISPFYDKWLVYNPADRKPGQSSALSRKIYTSEEWKNALRPSWDELLPIATRYASWLRANLDDSQFQLTDQQSITIGDANLEARKLTIAFSDEQIKSFLGGLIYKITHDDALLQLLHQKMTKANQMSSDTLGEQLVDIPGYEQWKLDMLAFSEDFTDGLNAMNFKDTKMDLWIDRGDHVYKREWQIGLQTVDDQEWDRIAYRSESDKPLDATWADTQFQMIDGDQTLLDTHLTSNTMLVSDEQNKTNWKWLQKLQVPDQEPIRFALDIQSDVTKTAQSEASTAQIAFGYGATTIEQTLRGQWNNKITLTRADQIDRTWELIWNVDNSTMNTDDLFPSQIHFQMNASEKSGTSIKLPVWNETNSQEIASLSAEQESEIISRFEEGLSSWIGDHFIELSVFFGILGE